MSNQSPRPLPIIGAELDPAQVPREVWPIWLIRAQRMGATAITLRVRWGQDLMLCSGVAHLCSQLGFALQIDIGGITMPPPEIVRANPSALTRDGEGQLVMTADGMLQANPLHPALRQLARQWVNEFAVALRALEAPNGPIVALVATDLTELVRTELARWLRTTGWSIPLLPSLPALPVPDGWPFGHEHLTVGPIARRAPTTLRGPALLARAAGISLAHAQPPAEMEGIRSAWADSSGVEVRVRHAAQTTYLSVDRQLPEPYSGVLTYRSAQSELLHVHVNMGPGRRGIVLVQDEEVIGAAFDGDASEAAWVARAMHSSIFFNGGGGAVIPCGQGMILIAGQSGRFQIRHPAGWSDAQVVRILEDGAILPAAGQFETAHMTIPYIAQDAAGVTDMYAVMPSEGELSEPLRSHLATLMAARAALLQRFATDSTVRAATRLAWGAEQLKSLTDYASLWDESRRAVDAARSLSTQRLRELRIARVLSSGVAPGDEEQQLAQRIAQLDAVLQSDLSG